MPSAQKLPAAWTAIDEARSPLHSFIAAVVAVVFTLVLGRWWAEKYPQPVSGILPLPISEMSFKLTDTRGRTVQPTDWIGRPTMVFFGFTWCPEICSTTLGKISSWFPALGAGADLLNTVLISVDPVRNTAEVLAEYLSNFDSRIVGLTGPMAEIERAVAGFRARFEKLPQNGDYLIDHTSGIFLFRADGDFNSIIDVHENRNYIVEDQSNIN